MKFENSEPRFKNLQTILKLIAAGMLFGALGHQQEDYYTPLRWVVCVVSILTCLDAVNAVDSDKTAWAWALAIVALVFNPLIPLHLTRDTWAFIDIASAVILLVSIAKVEVVEDLWGGEKTCYSKVPSKLRKRAEKGDALSQYAVACRLLKASDEADARSDSSVRRAYDEARTVFGDDGKWATEHCELALHAFACRKEKGRSEAVKWYRKAAEQNHADAQYKLGDCYFLGRGVERDYVEAIKWYRKAAEQNHADAHSRLSECKILAELLERTEKGDAASQYELASAFSNGRGVERDYVEAVKWFCKAAEQNHANAQDNLGDCYRIGRGVERDYVEAVKWFRKAAEQNHAGAQCKLGDCYLLGLGVKKDDVEAIKWYRKAAEQNHSLFLEATAQDHAEARDMLFTCLREQAEKGDALFQYEFASALSDGKIGKWSPFGSHYVEAVEWFRKASEQNHAKAQFSLGCCYRNGRGVEKDYVEAAKWYRKAAEQNHSWAQLSLGDCYYNGEGVEKDFVEAVKWYRKAAERNHSWAQYSLGKCYIIGRGVEKDYVEAVKWLRKAARLSECKILVELLERAEKDDAASQYELALAFSNGGVVETDHVDAAKWFRKAAEQNHANAQYKLGECYRNGRGVKTDYVEAVKWLRKAAELGLAEAQFELGLHYLLRFCDDKGDDEEAAVKWLRKAAEQGHAGAQRYLGSCYAKGTGIPVDILQAYKWYQLAADMSVNATEEAAELAALMSPTEFEAAQALYQEFKDTRPAAKPPISNNPRSVE